MSESDPATTPSRDEKAKRPASSPLVDESEKRFRLDEHTVSELIARVSGEVSANVSSDLNGLRNEIQVLRGELIRLRKEMQ